MAPLLVAQEVAGGTPPVADAEQPAVVAKSEPAAMRLPKGTRIDFILLEPLSSATAVKGQKVRLAVASDIKTENVLKIPRGTAAEGVVSGVRKAKPGKRDGELTFKPVRLTLHDGTGVKIREYPPGKDSCGPKGSCLLLIPIAVPLVFFFWPDLVETAWNDHKIRHRGIDKQVDACTVSHGYTGQNLAVVPAKDGQVENAEGVAASLDSICPVNLPATQTEASDTSASNTKNEVEMR